MELLTEMNAIFAKRNHFHSFLVTLKILDNDLQCLSQALLLRLIFVLTILIMRHRKMISKYSLLYDAPFKKKHVFRFPFLTSEKLTHYHCVPNLRIILVSLYKTRETYTLLLCSNMRSILTKLLRKILHLEQLHLLYDHDSSNMYFILCGVKETEVEQSTRNYVNGWLLSFASVPSSGLIYCWPQFLTIRGRLTVG